MNIRQSFASRTAIALAASAAMVAMVGPVQALGLGQLQVQSALGEGMRAEIDVSSITAEEAGTLSVRIARPEAYRTAGVDYNPVLAGTQAVLLRRADGRAYVRLSSDRAVQEPFVEAILELTWSGGRLVREYTMLFDPPTARAPAAPTAVAVAPVIAAAPTVTVVTIPAAAPRPTAPRPPRTRLDAATGSSARAAVAVGASGDKYPVQRGDSLSYIAQRNQRAGVSLDQMLAGLYRANPDAFINANINKLKAGVVLALPTAEAAKALSAAEARQLIVAQSADFGAYRSRLADAVPNAPADSATRAAQGKLQATVEDRKPGATASPDKLKLSGGAVRASGPQLAAATPAAPVPVGGAGNSAGSNANTNANNNDLAARIAELSRSIDELKRLQQQSAQTQSTQTAPTAVAAVKPVPVPAPMPAPVPAPPPPAAAPAPAPAPTPAPATQATPTTTTATPVAANPAGSAPGTTATAAPALTGATTPTAADAGGQSAASRSPVVAPRPTPAPAPPAPAPSMLDSLSDNPMLLPGAGILALVLAGFAAWRLRGKFSKPASETSFLESRMQPDSFFGASGGQRVDTRDASSTHASSSIGYSLSQLDAIGDVDPVAEADVYLAYGRDLQAEEILKEAMRSTPDRLAVRTKLLEVYAKRRDGKAFELLATQLYSLAHGSGPDWDKAQELGRQLDPENPMYQAGGRPEEVMVHDRVVEPLGATTLPQSGFAPSGHALTEPAMMTKIDSMFDLDLDLDLGEPSSDAMTVTQPLASGAARPVPDQSTMLDFDMPPMRPSPPPTPVVTQRMAMPERDEAVNSSMHMDLEPTVAAPLTRPAAHATTSASSLSTAHSPDPGIDFGDFSLSTGAGSLSEIGAMSDGATTRPGDLVDLGQEETNPLARKFDLAEEFRQIGDLEGARDLLEEVAAKASGALKAKARAMLDNLA